MSIEWRHLGPGDTDHETLWASVALVCGGLLACWIWMVEWPPVLCPFRAITGLPCPTCGSTRALFAFLGGRPLEALRLNPLAGATMVLAIPYLAYAGTVSTLRLPRLRVSWSLRARSMGRAGAWCAILAAWLFLVIDGR